ncbi:hypothetical protein HK097_001727 [Rhizophlyctis rosea]|uniref:SH3 domain-containing protein n=1 Tax=Rhizophlyctis rosea TaxID=64517 RepID=A0AAD5SHB6_9FUNG|nr:hypothetical protein HK097_001727 [Rhizophlyctis rosea]
MSSGWTYQKRFKRKTDQNGGPHRVSPPLPSSPPPAGSIQPVESYFHPLHSLTDDLSTKSTSSEKANPTPAPAKNGRFSKQQPSAREGPAEDGHIERIRNKRIMPRQPGEAQTYRAPARSQKVLKNEKGAIQEAAGSKNGATGGESSRLEKGVERVHVFEKGGKEVDEEEVFGDGKKEVVNQPLVAADKEVGSGGADGTGQVILRINGGIGMGRERFAMDMQRGVLSGHEGEGPSSPSIFEQINLVKVEGVKPTSPTYPQIFPPLEPHSHPKITTPHKQTSLQQPSQSDIATTPKPAMDESKPSSAVNAAMAEAFPPDDTNAAGDKGGEDEEHEGEEGECEGTITDMAEFINGDVSGGKDVPSVVEEVSSSSAGKVPRVVGRIVSKRSETEEHIQSTPSTSPHSTAMVVSSRERIVTAPENGVSGKLVVALYDFQGTSQGSLTFKHDDKIEIVKKSSDVAGWWTGKTGGRVGRFPANVVRQAVERKSGKRERRSSSGSEIDSMLSPPRVTPVVGRCRGIKRGLGSGFDSGSGLKGREKTRKRRRVKGKGLEGSASGGEERVSSEDVLDEFSGLEDDGVLDPARHRVEYTRTREAESASKKKARHQSGMETTKSPEPPLNPVIVRKRDANGRPVLGGEDNSFHFNLPYGTHIQLISPVQPTEVFYAARVMWYLPNSSEWDLQICYDGQPEDSAHAIIALEGSSLNVEPFTGYLVDKDSLEKEATHPREWDARNVHAHCLSDVNRKAAMSGKCVVHASGNETKTAWVDDGVEEDVLQSSDGDTAGLDTYDMMQWDRLEDEDVDMHGEDELSVDERIVDDAADAALGLSQSSHDNLSWSPDRDAKSREGSPSGGGGSNGGGVGVMGQILSSLRSMVNPDAPLMEPLEGKGFNRDINNGGNRTPKSRGCEVAESIAEPGKEGVAMMPSSNGNGSGDPSIMARANSLLAGLDSGTSDRKCRRSSSGTRHNLHGSPYLEIEKDFYEEHPETSAVTDAKVREFRSELSINVTGDTSADPCVGPDPPHPKLVDEETEAYTCPKDWTVEDISKPCPTCRKDVTKRMMMNVNVDLDSEIQQNCPITHAMRIQEHIADSAEVRPSVTKTIFMGNLFDDVKRSWRFFVRMAMPEDEATYFDHLELQFCSGQQRTCATFGMLPFLIDRDVSDVEWVNLVVHFKEGWRVKGSNGTNSEYDSEHSMKSTWLLELEQPAAMQEAEVELMRNDLATRGDDSSVVPEHLRQLVERQKQERNRQEAMAHIERERQGAVAVRLSQLSAEDEREMERQREEYMRAQNEGVSWDEDFEPPEFDSHAECWNVSDDDEEMPDRMGSASPMETAEEQPAAATESAASTVNANEPMHDVSQEHPSLVTQQSVSSTGSIHSPVPIKPSSWAAALGGYYDPAPSDDGTGGVRGVIAMTTTPETYTSTTNTLTITIGSSSTTPHPIPESKIEEAKPLLRSSQLNDSSTLNAPGGSTVEEGGGRKGLGKKCSGPGDELDDKQLRILYKLMKEFGDFGDRYEDIVKHTVLEDKDQDFVLEMVAELERLCVQALEADAEEGMAGKKKNDIFFACYDDMRMDAQKIVQRFKDLRVLASEMETLEKDLSFRMPDVDIKPVKNWSCTWGLLEDAMLLVGVWRHGHGRWERMEQDEELNLHGKFFLGGQKEEDADKRKPEAKHLRRRADYLLKVLGDWRGNRMEDEELELVFLDVERRKCDLAALASQSALKEAAERQAAEASEKFLREIVEHGKTKEKYRREIVEHGETSQNLKKVKDDHSNLQTRITEAEWAKEAAEDLLKAGETSWADRRRRMEEEITTSCTRIAKLEGVEKQDGERLRKLEEVVGDLRVEVGKLSGEMRGLRNNVGELKRLLQVGLGMDDGLKRKLGETDSDKEGYERTRKKRREGG